MNRRIFFQVAGPALVVGLVMLAACLAGAWYINRLQKNLATILSQNVTSLKAAQRLEIKLRQLRFHWFLYLFDPLHASVKPIQKDQVEFEKALRIAEELANQPGSPPRSRAYVRKIEEGYQRYRHELTQRKDQGLRKDLRRAVLELVEQTKAKAARLGPRADFGQLLDDLAREVARKAPHRAFQKWADDHPVRYIVDPCEDLLKVNNTSMGETAQESERVSRQARWIMVLVGCVGPAAGLIIGFGVARGLSRSIYRLSVRVQDMAQRLDQKVASVRIAADGDIRHLDKQLEHIVRQVEEVAERMQRHQRDMLRAEQLSAVGQLAAGVAHEVRNPLTSVNLLVESALRSHNRKPLTLEDLQVIHGEVARLEQTVQGFLDFARPLTLHRSPVPLREVIAQAVELVRARARQQQVEIVLRAPAEPAPADVDRSQLCNVLVNLFLNALDAMPGGGRLEVDLEAAPEGGAWIRVADSGAGIPPAILPRLFTPFASSKATGTGLGLSISRRIIEEHGGEIGGSNRPGGGAVFTIRLPGPCLANAEERAHADLVGRR
jgi:signal transduction histidine kinase